MPISPQLRLTLRVEQYNSSFRHHFWVAASQGLTSRCAAGLTSNWDAILCSSALFHGESAASECSEMAGESSLNILFDSKLCFTNHRGLLLKK